MGRLRIKKRKPRRMTAGQQAAVGFPEFWPLAQGLNPRAFAELESLGRFQNDLFRKMWGEPRLQVIRHIAKVCMNSLQATAILCLNGCGHDAMKLARSMYEGYITIAYLEKHPLELNDYIDFYHVTRKRQLDGLIARGSDIANLPRELQEDIEREFTRVEKGFRRGKGYRTHWCRNSLWDMAADVGLTEHHKTFYVDASNMHHVSIWGISNQVDDPTGDAEITMGYDCVDGSPQLRPRRNGPLQPCSTSRF